MDLKRLSFLRVKGFSFISNHPQSYLKPVSFKFHSGIYNRDADIRKNVTDHKKQ